MGVLESISLVITLIFLLVVLSYYTLLIIKTKKPEKVKKFNSITIIIPAHNEEMYIGEAIKSVIEAEFEGKKEIIVVDDGSIDKTAEIAARFKEIKLIKTKHSGKAASMNRALAIAKGELIAIVDGDSCIYKDALMEVAKEVERDNIVAACCPVRVRNRNRIICMWLHIAEIYFSLIRNLFSKIDANITTPGPLSVYRKKELLSVGGFSTDGFSEDADVTIRLIRKGYRIGFAERAIAETNMPHKVREFLRQRTRFARGLIKIFKKHMKMNKTIIDIYTLPIFFFGYVQSVIMGSISVYQIVNGYLTYFYSKGIYFNFLVARFFFDWVSMMGFIKWVVRIASGQDPLTLLAAVGIISTLLTYPLYLLAIIKYDRKFDMRHLIPIFFMFPFWFVMMWIHIISLPETLRKHQYNIWKKNE